MTRVAASVALGSHGRALGLTPSRALLLREDPSAEPVDEALAERLDAAVGRGAGHVLLYLGAAEMDTTLPATMGFWRNVGRLYVTHLCAQPDLEATRGRLEVPFPAEDAGALVAGAPPMPGGEYLDAEALARLWEETNAACRAELAEFDGTVEAYLQSRHAAWHVVGRVHFHLAENRASRTRPFAFLATYTHAAVRPRRARSTGRSARPSASTRGRGTAARCSRCSRPSSARRRRAPWLRELVDGGRRLPAARLDAATRPTGSSRTSRSSRRSGVVVRVPDWWKARRPPRPAGAGHGGLARPVGPRHGRAARLRRAPHARRRDAHRGGDRARSRRPPAASRWSAASGSRWIAARLREALEHWKKVERAARRDGISFVEGMRLLAGARDEAGPDAGALERSGGVGRRGRGTLARGDARRAPRVPTGSAALAIRPRAARRAAPLSGGGRRWLLAARAARARRLPRRRHGPRQDDPGARAAARR